MDPLVIIWLAGLVFFVVLEAFTVQMVCIWFAASALITLIAALLGAPLWLQLTIFPVCTVILLLFTRPIVRGLMKGTVTRTNADRILGTTAVVITGVDNEKAEGQIRVMNQVWSARSADGAALPADTKVIVRSIEGVKAIVEKI